MCTRSLINSNSGSKQSGMPARRGVIRCSQAGLDMETMFRKEGAAALVLDRFLVLRNPIPSRGAYEGAIQVGRDIVFSE